MEEALHIGQFQLFGSAVAAGEEAVAADEPASCPLYLLQLAEVLILFHPPAFEEVVLVLVALQLIHLFHAALEDGDERTHSDPLQPLQGTDDFTLVAHLHSHCSE